MLVDKWARYPRRNAEYEPHIFYGQLQCIFRVKFGKKSNKFKIEEGTEIIMVEIRTCNVDTNAGIRGLDVIKYYNAPLGATHCVDITSIDGLVGRVHLGGNNWAIIDRLNADATQRSFDYEHFVEDPEDDGDLPPRIMSL
jgi:hypothetical protein